MKPTRIIWHHSADSSEKPQLDNINNWHKQREFTLSSLGYYVGYHYLIERDGKIIQTRKDDEIGCHDKDENINSLGICLAGNFDVQLPNDAQQVSAAALTGALVTRWHIPITRIEPHRTDDDTHCPGLLLPDNWLIHNWLNLEKSVLHRAFWWLGEFLDLL